MKPTLALLALASLAFNVSCSSMGTDSTGRRYYHSAMPIQSKMGLTHKETRPQAAAATPAVATRYYHSAAPIPSKTGLQVAQVR
jgi:hypothetical protein